ncbi:MAG: hypothetical protein IPK16_18895 [Anaerolineales bacterium]|nr:hypothetical protein [Anaerolineales bacterium]
MAVADARNEAEYLRRSVGILTGAGAELAKTLEQRNAENELAVKRLAAISATGAGVAALTATRELTVAAPVETTPERSTADIVAEAVEHENQLLKLQAELDELQTELEGMTATKADLEAQLESRDGELSDLKGQLEALGVDLDQAAQFKEKLAGVLAKLAILNTELQPVVVEGAPVEDATTRAAEIAVEVPATADAAPATDEAAPALPEVATPVADTAPAAEAPAEAPAEAGEDANLPLEVTSLAASIAAALALLNRKKDEIAALTGEKDELTAGIDAQTQLYASTADRLTQTEDEMRQRSYQYDALGLRASSLESDLEIANFQSLQYDEQVRKIALQLQELAASAAPAVVAETPAADAATAPVAETAPEAIDASAADASAPVVDAAAAPAGDAAVAPVAETAPVVTDAPAADTAPATLPLPVHRPKLHRQCQRRQLLRSTC